MRFRKNKMMSEDAAAAVATTSIEIQYTDV
jgi:hypothetical protein